MARVLMVTPYWPPVNKVGIWRVLRTARYLPEYGWTPVICTPRPEDVYHEAPQLDYSFQAPDVEVIRPPARVPSMTVVRAAGKPRQWFADSGFSQSAVFTRILDLLAKGSFRLVAELLLPDQFVEWGIQAASYLNQQSDLDIDVVWATGGPFGMHVAGALIAERLNCPLVLDYRDPWNSFRPPRTSLIAPPQRIFQAIERWTLSQAKAVGYIHQEALTANRAMYGQPENTSWEVITNSFDPIDLGNLPPIRLSEQDGSPAIVYAGNFYEARSAQGIVKALIRLEELTDADDYPVKVHVFGRLDPPAQELLKSSPLPEHRLMLHPRRDAADIGAIMKGADALLLVIGEDTAHRIALSGKVWDYLAAGSPILGLGPTQAAARDLIEDGQLGIWADSRQVDDVVDALKQISKGDHRYSPTDHNGRYHARMMSGHIAKLLRYALSTKEP